MASSQSADDERYLIDPSEPFKDVIVCCTSIPPDQRTEIAQKVAELGGVHKYDLTPDVTHLVVGDYDTPKYRHVARERPDIKAMDAVWIDAVAELWKNDEEMDFIALEQAHQLKALEKCGAETTSPNESAPAGRQSLLICLTGFGEQRDDIAARIAAHGGRYTGDLTRRCTHLVVSKPEGKKFTAAKSWGVYTVTLEWLDQSIERGLILEESKFDPLLPAEDQGVGAWIKRDLKRASLGKRSRSSASNSTDERGARKLRKTASMKLNSQRNNLWGDILGRAGSREYSFSNEQGAPEQPTPEPTIQQPHQHQQLQPQQNDGVFANCVFAIHGFNEKRQTVLEDTIATLGGSVASSVREASTCPTPAEHSHRFLVVPQTSHAESHPTMSYDNVEIVTEFYIETCLHNKQFFSPEERILGRPFPVFPIPGFSDLVICSAAFTGLELNQVARSITQLGAKFEEEFRRTTGVLVCKSLRAMRKDKLKYALEWGVPVVSADWLWECISTGFNVPLDKYIFHEIRDRYPTQSTPAKAAKTQQSQDTKAKDNTNTTQATPAPTAPKPPTASRPKIIGGFDASAFEPDSPEKPSTTREVPARARGMPQPTSTTSADFMTARSQPIDTFAKDSDAPLAEVSSARLNKSPSPPKPIPPPTRIKSDPYPGDMTEQPTISRIPSAPPPEMPNTKPNPPVPQQQEQQQDNYTADQEPNQAATLQTKAAERQALSSKLSSLINSAAPSDRDSHTQAPPRARRRQLLGRAISNASNGSSAASIDGSGRQLTDSLRAVVAAATDDEADNPDTQPPSTQLQYADPEAQQAKKALMDKMMGREEPPPPTNNSVVVGGRRSLRNR